MFGWRDLPRLDRAILVLATLAGLLYLSGKLSGRSLLQGYPGVLLLFLVVLAGLRWLRRSRRRILWSLRNRLIVAYLLIAVVPVLLLIVMAGLSAYLLYFQYGAYAFTQDLQRKLDKVESVARAISTVLPAKPANAASSRAADTALTAIVEAARSQLPGLGVKLNEGRELLRRPDGQETDRFAGIVRRGRELFCEAVVDRRGPAAPLVVAVSVPITAEFLEDLAPELGPIHLTLMRPPRPGDPPEYVGRRFVPLGEIATRRRVLPPAAYWLDYEIRGFTNLDAIADPGEATFAARPGEASNLVVVFFTTRPSQVNRRLFASLGTFSGSASFALVAVGAVFLLIELIALRTGIRLTRSITGAVTQLYDATQHVRSGELTYRVRIQTKDQLGDLGESFNDMTNSIAALIEEQRQRQRLENELSIAREVQAQLFPQAELQLPGICVAAVWRAARMVSGDYYDFIQLGPSRLAMVIADISGKGISAALLMASIQAAARSYFLMEKEEATDTARIVRRLNRHLYLNTSADRYATFFIAVYDGATRTLRYTNAGHLPPVCIMGDKVIRLEAGGMVVGLFDDSHYDQGTLQMEPGALLVAFSDGLIEPENAYGEEFGAARLQAEVLRHRNLAPRMLADSLVAAVEEWSGAPEQSDDMTVIAARVE